MIRLPALLVPLLLLAACSDEPTPATEAAPAGEVLEGSISDEMIAYDRLRSQPPRAAPLPGEEGAAAPVGGAGLAAQPSDPDRQTPAVEPPAIVIPPPIVGE